MSDGKLRKEQIGRLSRFLRKYSQPRFQLFIILLLTASAGAGASFLLLKGGLTDMWIRYPAAAVIAYLMFLVMLRLWAQRQLSSPNMPTEEGSDPMTPHTGKKRSVWDVMNPFDLLDVASVLGEAPAVLFIVAILTIAVIILGIIIAAPVLLAEVLLDGLLVAGLWHRFKRYGEASSLRGAVRATVIPAVIVVVCLAVVGLGLQIIEPGADSIGDLFREGEPQ